MRAGENSRKRRVLALTDGHRKTPMQPGRSFDRREMRTRAFTKPETSRRPDQVVRGQSSRSVTEATTPTELGEITRRLGMWTRRSEQQTRGSLASFRKRTTIDDIRVDECSQFTPAQAICDFGTSRLRGNRPAKADRHVRQCGDGKKGHSRFEAEGAARAAPTATRCVSIFPARRRKPSRGQPRHGEGWRTRFRQGASAPHKPLDRSVNFDWKRKART